ncbi:MAG: TolC family protein [Bacteroidales bacterium]|nr:TolC family protein [Bacteroidales bacterium]
MKPLSIILFLVLSAPLWAQPGPSPVPLSPDSCVAMALRNQVAVKNAALDLSAARETRRAAFTQFFPSIALQAGYFKAQHPLIDLSASENRESLSLSAAFDGHPITAEETERLLQQLLALLGYDVNASELVSQFTDRLSVDAQLQMLDHGVFANLTLTQPLFAGGRIVNGNRLAAVGVEAAALQLDLARDQVELHAYTLYWQIVSLYEKQRTLHYLQRMLDTLERDVAVAVAAGLTGRNDLLKVQIKQNETSVSALQLDNGIALATWALRQYICVPDTAAPFRFDTLPFDTPIALPTATLNTSSGSPSVDAEGRPESRLLHLSVEAARLQKLMTVGQALPTLAVGATYGYNNIAHTPMRPNGLIFATLSVPLTAWWQSTHDIRKNELQRQKAENTRADMQQKLTLQTLQSWNQTSEAYALIAVRRLGMEQAADNLVEVKNHFDAGMTSMTELLEAYTLLSQARNQWVDQVIDYLIKSKRHSQLTSGKLKAAHRLN